MVDSTEKQAPYYAHRIRCGVGYLHDHRAAGCWQRTHQCQYGADEELAHKVDGGVWMFS